MTEPHVTSVCVTSWHRVSCCPCALALGGGRCFASKFGMCGSPPLSGVQPEWREELWFFVDHASPFLASFELAGSKGAAGICAKGPVPGDAAGLGGACR